MVILGIFGLILAVLYLILLAANGALSLRDWWWSIVGPPRRFYDQGKRDKRK